MHFSVKLRIYRRVHKMRPERDFDGERPFMRRNTAPVKVGDEVDVKIEAVGEKGDGVAKVKGFVVFVPNTKEGESCKVRITRVLKKVGFAEKVGEASESASEESSEEKTDMEEEEDLSADSEDSVEEASEVTDDTEEF